MKKSNKILLSLIVILLGIVALIMFFVNSINERNSKLGNYSKYAIIGKENIIVVYDSRLALKIPYEIQVDKNTTYGDLVREKNYDKVLESLNIVLPEKVDVYRRIKFGNVELDVKNWINLPETSVDGSRYMLTSNLDAIFKEYLQIYDVKNTDFSEVILDILNAKGKTGYARAIGEKLKGQFGLKYNAANYENYIEESYIIINEISMDKMEKIIMELDEKYFKVKKDSTMPTLANSIIVLGKEQNVKTQIEIIGNKEAAGKIEKQLSGLNYKNIKTKIQENLDESNAIEYSEENYFIAYKLGEKLGIRKLEKNNDLKDLILIKLKK